MQGEEPQWQLSRSEHNRDMQRVEARLQDFTLGVVGLSVLCADVFFTLGLQVALPGNHGGQARLLSCMHALLSASCSGIPGVNAPQAACMRSRADLQGVLDWVRTGREWPVQ